MTFKIRTKYKFMLTGEFDGRHGIYNFYSNKWEGVGDNWLDDVKRESKKQVPVFKDGRCSVAMFGTEGEAKEAKKLNEGRGIVMNIRKFPTWIALRMTGQVELPF